VQLLVAALIADAQEPEQYEQTSPHPALGIAAIAFAQAICSLSDCAHEVATKDMAIRQRIMVTTESEWLAARCRVEPAS